MVENSFSGSIKPLLKDITTERTETFYVHSIADGGATKMEGPYTIKIACDQSIDIRQDPAFPSAPFKYLVDKTVPTQ